jgi:fluoride ion exporter CrcB/FEX
MKEGAIAAVPSVTVPVIWSVLGYTFPAGSMFVGLLACFMIRLFITLDAPGPKRWILDGIVTGLAMLITAVWIVEHQVDLFAALGTGASTGAVGAGIISFFKRRGQSAIDALDAALPGKPAVPPEIAAALRKLDKID